MPSTKMAFAIFWLPLIASLLLGSLAIGAWYGGSKTLAVWVGFVGATCFLLTGALQLQQHVWTVANQPYLTLTPSNQSFFLRWDPPKSFQMQINNIPDPDYGAWKVPKLHIQNAGQFAQDATIKWGVTPYDRNSLISSSKRLKDVKIILEQNRITCAPNSGAGTPFIHDVEWSGSLQLPFLTRNVETFIPLQVWQNAALFFIATMPNEPEAKSEPFYFDVQINWNIPEGGDPKRFRIRAIAHNAKLAGSASPAFLAKIELTAVNQE